MLVQHCFNHPKVMLRLKSDKEKVKALQDFVGVIKNYNLEQLQQEKRAIENKIEYLTEKINLNTN